MQRTECFGYVDLNILVVTYTYETFFGLVTLIHTTLLQWKNVMHIRHLASANLQSLLDIQILYKLNLNNSEDTENMDPKTFVTALFILCFIQSLLSVQGVPQASGDEAKAGGVWFTRGDAWMFHPGHKNFRMQVKTKLKVTKDAHGGRRTYTEEGS